MSSSSRQIRHASRFLRANDAIGSLLADIERNARLLDEIRGILPPSLAAHCLHAAVEQGILVLLSDSPVWGSRLRFVAPELQRALEPRHGGIADCRIRIAPPSLHCANERSAPEAKLSRETVMHLFDAAESAKDEEIAAALRRLAARAGHPDQTEAANGRR